MSTNLDKLRQLGVILKNPQTWPSDFEWDYGIAECCALGLAMTVNIIPDRSLSKISTCADDFGITREEYMHIFFEADGDDKSTDDITPDDVAVIVYGILNKYDRVG